VITSKGLDTHNVYLGHVILSLSSGQRIADMVVPIYSKKNILLGIWGGALEFNGLNKSLQALNLTQINERVVYLGQHGNMVADSDKRYSLSNQTKSFTDLQSFKDAREGKSGSLVEIFNNTKVFIAYQPVKLASSIWVVLLMQPYNDVFLSSNNAIANVPHSRESSIVGPDAEKSRVS
jgi:hypothetical protein